MHGSAIIGNKLFIFGGDTPKGWTNAVFSTDILPNGKLGEWKEQRRMPEIRLYINCSSEVVNNRIYVVGGSIMERPDSPEDQNTPAQDVLWTTYQPDGTLSEWKRSEPYPGLPVSCAATCSTDNFIFILGGSSRDKISDEITVGEFGPDGAPCKWRAAGRMPIKLWFHAASLVEDRLYIWGGLCQPKNTPANEKVFSAPVFVTGSLGEWREETAMPKATFSATCCGFNDYLINVAGRYAKGVPTNSIWYARLTDKKVGQWQEVGTDLDARIYHALGLDRTKGMVYIIGGQKRVGTGLPTAPLMLDTVQMFRLSQPNESRLTVAPSATGSTVSAGEPMLTSVDQALARARATGKRALVLFFSPEVPACRRLWDNVIKTPQFAELVKPYVFAAVDTTGADATYSYKYAVFRVPCFVEIGPDDAPKRKSGWVGNLEQVQKFLQGQ